MNCDLADIRCIRIIPVLALALCAGSPQEKPEALLRSLSKATREDEIEAVVGKIAAIPGASGELRKAALETLDGCVSKRRGGIAARVKASTVQSLRALKIELNRRRETAIRTIEDRTIYLPEDDPRGGFGASTNGQDKVDKAVDDVRRLWEAPGAYLLPRLFQIGKDLQRLAECRAKCLFLLGAEAEADAAENWERSLVEAIDAQVDLRTFALNGQESAVRDWNRRVARYNDALTDEVVPPEAREHGRVLNGYREMLGLRHLYLDSKLCRAATKHSGVCSAAGKIWHIGSDGTPESRLQAEKFQGGFCGENVGIGCSSPADFWWLIWYRASDHHRAAIKTEGNCFGYGQSGSVATQVFGSAGIPKGL